MAKATDLCDHGHPWGACCTKNAPLKTRTGRRVDWNEAGGMAPLELMANVFELLDAEMERRASPNDPSAMAAIRFVQQALVAVAGALRAAAP